MIEYTLKRILRGNSMKKIARLIFLSVLALSAAAMPDAKAQSDYPGKPVHIIIGFASGAAADITARLLGQGLGRILGQQFIVEAKPGAGSTLAAEFVARAAPDGYTLFLASSANMTNEAINPNISVLLAKDFAPIALVNTGAVILVVNPSTGVKTVKELIALAKAKPGQVNYASTGVGAAPHLAGELFAQRAGVQLVHVPYKGSPQAVTDLLSGQTSMMFSPASTVVGQIAAGKLTALASAAAKRPSIAPDVPTMAEAGMPDFDTSIWFGLMAPAGTPRAIVDKLARAVDEAMKARNVQDTMGKTGFDRLAGGPDDFAKYLQSEARKWGEIAKAAGLKK
jgi:tripartite-type tricarboxylate transporter receptor subunit TctC